MLRSLARPGWCRVLELERSVVGRPAGRKHQTRSRRRVLVQRWLRYRSVVFLAWSAPQVSLEFGASLFWGRKEECVSWPPTEQQHQLCASVCESGGGNCFCSSFWGSGVVSVRGLWLSVGVVGLCAAKTKGRHTRQIGFKKVTNARRWWLGDQNGRTQTRECACVRVSFKDNRSKKVLILVLDKTRRPVQCCQLEVEE